MTNNKIVSEALYRKYRPQDFEEVLGQEEVVSALKNSLKNKNISHAYLFSGGRGSGKTTLARIFAKELGVSPADVYEIDAASNRGIDQIRELRDSVKILPMESNHKVYIIDEVHMLTKEAFNALLKTLEEPPRHIVFILATTEKNKVLETILSRCQNFNFRKADLNILKKMVEDVSKKEKVKISDGVALEIARKGNGSFRDTLSELQRRISIQGKELRKEDFLEESQRELVALFLDNLKNKEELYKIYLKVLKKNIPLESFIESLLDRIRKILLIKNSLEMERFYGEEFSQGEIELFKKNQFLNSLYLKKFLDLLDLSKKTSQPEVALEIFINEIFE